MLLAFPSPPWTDVDQREIEKALESASNVDRRASTAAPKGSPSLGSGGHRGSCWRSSSSRAFIGLQNKSATTDEPAHLAYGRQILEDGTFHRPDAAVQLEDSRVGTQRHPRDTQQTTSISGRRKSVYSCSGTASYPAARAHPRLARRPLGRRGLRPASRRRSCRPLRLLPQPARPFAPDYHRRRYNPGCVRDGLCILVLLETAEPTAV